MDARAWDKIRKKKKKTVLPRYHHVVCIEKKKKTFMLKTSIAESASISV